jgi:short-subunit dehydrogenase
LRHIPCDLADPAQRAAAFDEIEKFISEGGDLSPVLLINNAGFGSYGNFPTGAPGREAAIVSVNIAAVVEITARLMPQLRSRGGGIINVASTAAFQATPTIATYGATKAFLLNWSLALREELRPHGVPVVAVCPGPTRTAFFKNAGLDGSQADDAFGSDVGDVVDAALDGLARGSGIVVPGIRNKFIRIASALVPRTLAARVSGRVLARARSSGGPGAR